MFEPLEALRSPAAADPLVIPACRRTHRGQGVRLFRAESFRLLPSDADRVGRHMSADPYVSVPQADPARRGFRKAAVAGCDQGLQTEFVPVLDLPQGVRWLRLPLSEQPVMPPYHPQCHSVPVEGGVLSIRSPTHGAQYLLLASLGQRALHVPLDLQGSGAAKDISCLLNGRQFSVEHQGFVPCCSSSVGGIICFVVAWREPATRVIFC